MRASARAAWPEAMSVNSRSGVPAGPPGASAPGEPRSPAPRRRGRLSGRKAAHAPALGGEQPSKPIDGPASAVPEISTESLILAQDERWRRA